MHSQQIGVSVLFCLCLLFIHYIHYYIAVKFHETEAGERKNVQLSTILLELNQDILTTSKKLVCLILGFQKIQ